MELRFLVSAAFLAVCLRFRVAAAFAPASFIRLLHITRFSRSLIRTIVSVGISRLLKNPPNFPFDRPQHAYCGQKARFSRRNGGQNVRILTFSALFPAFRRISGRPIPRPSPATAPGSGVAASVPGCKPRSRAAFARPRWPARAVWSCASARWSCPSQTLVRSACAP